MEMKEKKQISYLEKYYAMKKAINEWIDMPDYMASRLVYFVQKNNGTLSKRAREKEFGELSDRECQTLETLYKETFRA